MDKGLYNSLQKRKEQLLKKLDKLDDLIDDREKFNWSEEMLAELRDEHRFSELLLGDIYVNINNYETAVRLGLYSKEQE